MSIFAKGTAEIDQLKAENSKLVTQIEQLTAFNESAENDLAEAANRIQALETSQATMTEGLESIRVEFNALKEENAKLRIAAPHQAQQVLSTLGVEPVAESSEQVTNPSKTREELLTEMKAIKDPVEKNEFYQKHLKNTSPFRRK